MDVKDNTYIDSMEWHSHKKVNDKVPKFKVADHVRISKYKFQIGRKKFWWLKNKKYSSLNISIKYLNGDEIIGTFYEEKLQKTNQQEFRIEKVVKKKGDKLYVKWKGYNCSFDSWIDKKGLIIDCNSIASNWANIF